MARSYWRELLCLVLAGMVLVMSMRLDAKTAEHEAFVAKTEAAAAVAIAQKQVTEQKQVESLKHIEEKHNEEHVKVVRRRAIDHFRGRLQLDAGGGVMPGIAASQPADDGTREECAAAYAIVADAAEDADTLAMWQEWARLNKIPVVNDAGL